MKETADLAKRIRQQSLRMIRKARSSHIGSAFSIAEVLAVLYAEVLRVDPLRPEWPERDRMILSKGHACAALYAVLAERGFFPREWLGEFYQDGGRLAGHATHHGVPGVEASTGSLGHGLSLACGMALAGARDEKPYRVFAILSDGECDEGSTWEAAMFAAHHKLDRLIAIVDYNKIQSLGRVEEVLELEPFAAKWQSFGWGVAEVDGHEVERLRDAFSRVPLVPGRPSCVIAHTIKGRGVSFMENQLLWHYRSPDDGEFERALRELEES
jgi:transketolase